MAECHRAGATAMDTGWEREGTFQKKKLEKQAHLESKWTKSSIYFLVLRI